MRLGYKAFYKGRELELYADSAYDAQKKAAATFKARKAYEVSVVLCEKDGETVVHQTSEFG